MAVRGRALVAERQEAAHPYGRRPNLSCALQKALVVSALQQVADQNEDRIRGSPPGANSGSSHAIVLERLCEARSELAGDRAGLHDPRSSSMRYFYPNAVASGALSSRVQQPGYPRRSRNCTYVVGSLRVGGAGAQDSCQEEANRRMGWNYRRRDLLDVCYLAGTVIRKKSRSEQFRGCGSVSKPLDWHLLEHRVRMPSPREETRVAGRGKRQS